MAGSIISKSIQFTRRNALLGAIAVSGRATAPIRQSEISKDEYEIYRLMVGDYKCITGDTVNFINTSTVSKVPASDAGTRTISPRSIAYVSNEHNSELSDELVEAFFTINRKSYGIDQSKFDKNCFRFVEENESIEIRDRLLELERTRFDRRIERVKRSLAGEKVPRLPAYEHYDMRLRRFSRIGFNLDRSQALGFHGFFCGGLCAESSLYLAKKNRDRWSIAWDEVYMVS